MIRITVETPLNAPTDEEVEDNKAFARQCCHDALMRGEAPLASHLLYTQMLNDRIPEEREMGIEAGLEWAHQAEKMVFYLDRGWSPGMLRAEGRAIEHNISIEYRYLYIPREGA